MKKHILLTIFLLISIVSFSQKKKEIHFQMIFANAMLADNEYVLDDNSRVDIVNDQYAIEVDFAQKWTEGIGQALYYATVLEREAGILLIIISDSDEKYIKRLMTVAMKYNITVWIIDYNTDVWKKIEVTKNYSY